MGWVNTSPLVRTYTLEEFWRLPAPPDGSKPELIAGVIYMTPPPEAAHDQIVTRLIRCLTLYLAHSNDGGNLYVPRAAIWTGPATYVETDLFYLSANLEERLEPNHRDTADLVVEVISPGSAIYDRNTKADTYGALGVRELWLVDQTAQTVEVRNQTGAGFGGGKIFAGSDRIESVLFSDLHLGVDEIFRGR